jgi:hypothetical protein
VRVGGRRECHVPAGVVFVRQCERVLQVCARAAQCFGRYVSVASAFFYARH